ncbi:MAG: hypothetical protein E7666_08180 [Ruminococcaceae bacterium]|nr:hypothetical protein [Oscillospiraceae bacterium]
MKKRILCFLLCAITLLSLVACASEKYDLLYSVDVGDVTYCVRGSGTRAKQIVLKKGDEIVWAKKVKIDSEVGNLGETFGFEATDLNFDGVTDFMIASEIDKDCISYLCYVWNAEKETYQLSEELGKLYNVKADTELKAIFGFSHTHETEKAYLDVPAASIDTDIATKYVWKDGKLLPQMRTSVTFYSETNRYLYSVAYYNAETREWTDDFYSEKWFTPEEYAEQDLSFLYYFK